MTKVYSISDEKILEKNVIRKKAYCIPVNETLSVWFFLVTAEIQKSEVSTTSIITEFHKFTSHLNKKK